MSRARDLAAFVSNADGDIKFDTDTLFIDSSANRVGISTNTPSAPLQVAQTPSDTVGNVGISLKDVDNAIEFGLRLDSTSKDLHLDRYFNGGWHNHMSFDRSTGNVGIGTVPDTWTAYTAQQIKDGCIASTTGNNMIVGSNAYYNGGWKYASTNTASLYQQGSGGHNFRTASSGTADAAITFAEKVAINEHGLTFNGDTAADNALSDYEEGEHEVTLTPSGSGSISVSGSNNDVSYTKIGNRVYVSGQVLATSSSSPVGYTKVSLPFPIKNSGTANTSRRVGGLVSIRYTSINTNQYTLLGVENESFIRIYRADGTDLLSTSANQFASMPGTGISVLLNFTYPTDS
tara:strand:- start:1501 stop:2538 length:1038 start_codon:yes stop_codon:yes gene_type:complete